MAKFILGFVFLLATACAPFTTAAPLPTRQPVRVSLPPALRPWGSRLQDCAVKDQSLDLFLEEAAPGSQTAAQASLSFHLGIPANPSPAYLVQVGAENIVILVNATNPFDQLSQTQLHDLFSGQVSHWEVLTSAPSGFTGEVHLWTYPASDELRQAFETAVFGGGKSQAQAMLAPEPQAMLDAVASDKNAIGYAPGSWLESAASEQAKNLKQIKLESTLQQTLHQPILVASTAEPQGAARALLVCLEKK